MNQKIICRFCKKEIIQGKREPDHTYKKRLYHKECVYKGMRKDKKGFYNSVHQAFPVRRTRFIPGSAGLDLRILDDY